MDKKLLMLGVAVALVAVMSGAVSAGMTTYPFTDMLDFTSSSNPFWVSGDSRSCPVLS